MKSRSASAWTLAAFAAIGAVAALVWVALDAGRGVVRAPAADDAAAVPPAVQLTEREEGAPAPAASTADAVRSAPAREAADSEPESFDLGLRTATDYFAFAQTVIASALAGDARAQYLLGRALHACREHVDVVASMGKGNAAADLQAYLALLRNVRPEARARVERDIARCERFFEGSPLDGLAVPEDAHYAGYWNERALDAGDALAVMDRALEESEHQHADTMPEDHRVQLLSDVRIAIASREPAALFRIGSIYSKESIALDPGHGAAWLIAACNAGYDCSNANPEIGQGCAELRSCDAQVTLPERLREDLGAEQFARAHADATTILHAVERGDWEVARQFLEVK